MTSPAPLPSVAALAKPCTMMPVAEPAECSWFEYRRQLAIEASAEWRWQAAWDAAFRPQLRLADDAQHEAEVLNRDVYADGTPLDGDESRYGDNYGVPARCRPVKRNPSGLTPRQVIGSAKCKS